MPLLPHTPSFDSKVVRPQRTIKSRMEDGSIMARVKSDPLWEIDVVYKSRQIQEYLDIEEFYESFGEHTKFQYEHLLTGEIYDVVFDGPIECTQGSFDSVDFNFKLVEWAGGTVTLPTLTALPQNNLVIDVNPDSLSATGAIDSIFNQAPSHTTEGWFSSGSNQPTRVTAQANGHSILRFDGSNDYMIGGNYVTIPPDFTFYAVFKATPVGTPLGYERVFDMGFPAGPTVLRGGTAANTWGASILQGDYPYGMFATNPDNSYIVVYGSRQGTNSYLYKAGETISYRNCPDTVSLQTMYLGTSAGGAYFKGDLARILFYDSFHNSLKRHQIYYLLKSLYGTV